MPIIQGFSNAFKIEEVRKRILFTLAILVVFRLGVAIALPNINTDVYGSRIQAYRDSLGGFGGFLQMSSGGGFQNIAIFTLGIMPYITASIIMQLLTKTLPALEAIAKEGPAGQRKISQYTRYLAVPICVFQGLGSISLIRAKMGSEVFISDTFFGVTVMIFALTAGALFVMWLGEQITEHGVGNGASILIMAGIVARLPESFFKLVGEAQSPNGSVGWGEVITLVVLYGAVIVGVVILTQAQRRIPLQHAKHFRGRRVTMGGRTYLPVRVNTSGVMPVIFASSVSVFLAMVLGIVGLAAVGEALRSGSFFETILYCGMIFFFSYVWTYMFFQPTEMANQLKEYGSFVPGIRPGETTAVYVDGILKRITLCGAFFLCVIARVPDMVALAFGGEIHRDLTSFLGGTGVLIIVGVALDVATKIESHLVMHHYSGFLESGAIRGRRGGGG